MSTTTTPSITALRVIPVAGRDGASALMVKEIVIVSVDI